MKKDNWIWIIGLAVLLSCAEPFMFMPSYTDGSPQAVQPCQKLKNIRAKPQSGWQWHGVWFYKYYNKDLGDKLAFLESEGFSAPFVYLCPFDEHNVGEAYYTVIEKTESDAECFYVLYQHRETFQGVVNYNGLSQGVPNPPIGEPYLFLVNFFSCCDYEVGDTLGICKPGNNFELNNMERDNRLQIIMQ